MTDTRRWVLVGAGSAGCVLANRLSADPANDVLLLEDGPDLAPGTVPDAIAGPSFFAAMAEPGRLYLDLPATRTADSAATLYQRGRGVGGSSVVNAMVALRGDPALYERWGWSDADQAWDRVRIPTSQADPAELGAIDLALRTDARTVAVDLTRRNGSRVTSAEAYLWPVVERPNLQVRANATVDTVVFDGRQAIGVRLDDGTVYDADRVVLCAGAIHSPTILLRSGVDTPGIGVGLQDHPSAVFALQLRPDVVQDRTGLAIGSILDDVVNGNRLQLLAMSHLGLAPESAGLGAVMAALLTPVGNAGSVTIDGDGLPVIDFAMLTDDRDIAGLSDAVKLALEVLDSDAFHAIIEAAYIDDRGTTIAALDSDQAIAHWLRSHCADYVHATSTCALGTVVDDNGAVFGYHDLYVVDASVFPTIPDANTHLPTTMVAERLAPRLS